MLLGSLLNDGGVSRTIVWALHCLQSPMTICPLVSQPFSITGNCEDSEGSVGGCGTAGVCGGGSGGGGDGFCGVDCTGGGVGGASTGGGACGDGVRSGGGGHGVRGVGCTGGVLVVCPLLEVLVVVV